ncbi:hypothetical protein CSUI_006883, partial [Cystoisospora suis]
MIHHTFTRAALPSLICLTAATTPTTHLHSFLDSPQQKEHNSYNRTFLYTSVYLSPYLTICIRVYLSLYLSIYIPTYIYVSKLSVASVEFRR